MVTLLSEVHAPTFYSRISCLFLWAASQAVSLLIRCKSPARLVPLPRTSHLASSAFFRTFFVLLFVNMPPAKPKPSDIASEAKRVYIPYIAQNMSACPPTSDQCPDSAYFVVGAEKRGKQRLRVAIIDGDPVDVALDWHLYTAQSSSSGVAPRIPAVNMANEKRPGGDWESGLLAPEECLCRRSNLIHTLLSMRYPSIWQTTEKPQYPLPQRGGVYSPYVGGLLMHKPNSIPILNVYSCLS